MAGRAVLSITTKSHKNRRSKSVSGQKFPPHPLMDFNQTMKGAHLE